jgi:hypothetical protein
VSALGCRAEPRLRPRLDDALHFGQLGPSTHIAGISPCIEGRYRVVQIETDETVTRLLDARGNVDRETDTMGKQVVDIRANVVYEGNVSRFNRELEQETWQYQTLAQATLHHGRQSSRSQACEEKVFRRPDARNIGGMQAYGLKDSPSLGPGSMCDHDSLRAEALSEAIERQVQAQNLSLIDQRRSALERNDAIKIKQQKFVAHSQRLKSFSLSQAVKSPRERLSPDQG